MYQGQYGLTHIIFSRILYKCSSNAHIFFGIKKYIEKLYHGQQGLTHFSLIKDSIKFSLKVHAFFSVSKVFKKFESRTIWFNLYCYLENIDQLLSKAHIANSGQDKIRI